MNYSKNLAKLVKFTLQKKNPRISQIFCWKMTIFVKKNEIVPMGGNSEGYKEIPCKNVVRRNQWPWLHDSMCLTNAKETRGVSHCGLAINIKKYLKAKEELWKFKYFIMQNYNLQKTSLKETKILQDITTLISSFNISQNIIF